MALERPNLKVFKDLPVTLWTDWSFTGIKGAIDAHDLGRFTETALLSEAILRDDRVGATLNTRVLGLLGLPHTVEPSIQADRRKSRVVARKVEESWDQMFPDEATAQFLRWARLMGFGLAEILWEGDEDEWRFSLKPWHPSFVWYDITRRVYVVNTQDGPVDVVPGDGKWFLYAPEGFYRGWIQGAVRQIAVPWLGRQYAFRDWLRFNEVYGLPIRKIKAPSQADEAEKDAFFGQIATIGSDGTVLCPQGIGEANNGWDLELVEATATAWQTFQGTTEDCDRRIAISILGQNLTTEVSGGSFAAAKVHGQVRQDYLEADAKTLANALRAQVLMPWAAYNFGDPKLAPRISWDTAPPDDLKTEADMLVQVSTAILNLAQSAPMTDIPALLDRFKIPVRDLPLAPPPEAAPPAPDGAPAPDTSEMPDLPAQAPLQGTLVGSSRAHEHLSRPVQTPKASRAAQAYLDDLCGASRDRATEAIRPDVDRLRKAIERAGSYDEMRLELSRAFEHLDPTDLAKVTHEALELGSYLGRYAILEDTSDEQP